MSHPEPSPGSYRKPRRVSLPLDEAVFPWLGPLLDAYHRLDQGVAEGIRREENRGRTLACAKGCSSCCRTHKTIPVYPLELVGLTWYAVEKVGEPLRGALKQQLRAHQSGEPCPFLVDGICSVHPLRPMACRQFNVFGRTCADGEDAYYSRRRDVLTPIAKYTNEALAATLPFYGVDDAAERRRLVKSGAVHQLAKVLQECSWRSVADRMDDFDRRNPPPE